MNGELTAIAKAVIYSFVAFVIGAATQAAQVAILMSASPLEKPSGWLISAAAGIVSAGLLAAIPYLKAVLPGTPAP